MSDNHDVIISSDAIFYSCVNHALTMRYIIAKALNVRASVLHLQSTVDKLI